MTAGTHVGAAGQIAGLHFGAGPAGLVLGRNVQRQLVPVRMFREEPVRVAMIGGWWLASLVAFRALAVGARVVVRTAAADRWHPLVRAEQGAERLAVVVGEHPIEVAGSWSAPVLLIDDFGPAGPARPTGALGPWQTRLTVLPWLTPAGAALAGSATLVLAQRLSPEEAAAVADVMRLSDGAAGLLQGLHEDMVALIGGANRYLWTSPTTVETHFFGAPHRSA